MKKIIYGLFIVFSFVTVSCMKNNTKLQSDISETATPIVVEKNESDMQKENNDRTENNLKIETYVKKEITSSKIDIDFSKMNYNMISSIMYNMLVEPKIYDGKTAKISGNFYYTKQDGYEYYFVLIWDATGCCPAGLPFIPTDSLKEKISTINQDDQITVTGKLKLVSSEYDYEELFLMAEKIE